MNDRDRFKLRFWDKKTRRMRKVWSLTPFGPVACDSTKTGMHREPLDNCVIMQCTGVKDKHGKLIYEWDIVKETTRGNSVSFYKVVWDINQAYGINSPGFQLVEPKTHACTPFSDKIEVIGNIYENPELLEEQCANQLNRE